MESIKPTHFLQKMVEKLGGNLLTNTRFVRLRKDIIQSIIISGIDRLALLIILLCSLLHRPDSQGASTEAYRDAIAMYVLGRTIVYVPTTDFYSSIQATLYWLLHHTTLPM